jgi:hypothetical protein
MTPISFLKSRHGRALVAVAGALFASACRDVTVPDLNNPQQSDITNLTDRSQIQAVARGIADQDRQTYATQVLFDQIISRNLYRIDPAESRYITRLLGASLSNSDFIGSSGWNGPYRTARTVDLFIGAVKKPSSAIVPALSTQEQAAAIGYAQTLKALEYIRIIEQRGSNGAPINTITDTLVAIRCQPAVLAYISSLLDSAATNLTAAGTTAFPFTLPAGFAGFTTPDAPGTFNDFLGFNRGLKARVELYRGLQPLEVGQDSTAAPDQTRLQVALRSIDSSFYSPTFTRGGLDVGVYHTFTTGQGETVNPLVDLGVFRANPKVVAAAEKNDQRITAKIDTSSANVTRSLSGVSSNYLIKYPGAPTDRLALLKNGELVLERALILWGLGRDAEALTLVNGVRSAAGLTTPLTITDHNALRHEILRQIRFELLFESEVYWTLARATGTLNTELGQERKLNPLARFPIPSAENTARSGKIACTA